MARGARARQPSTTENEAINHRGHRGHRVGITAEHVHINELSEQVIGAAITVHRELGPGMLESTYERCMALELRERGVSFERQKRLPVVFKGTPIDFGYRVDMLVDGRLVLELKAVKALEPVHHAQLLAYLKLSGCHVGLLINFNVHVLRSGITRLVRGSPDAPPDNR